jgi:hypothetical protein
MIRGTRVRRGAAALLVFIVVSCGGRVDSSPPTLKAVDFPTAAARALCENVGQCCKNAGRTFDSAQCISLTEPEFNAQFSLSPEAAQTQIPKRCLDEVVAAARQCRTWFPCTELLEALGNHAARGQPCSGICYPLDGSLACNAGRGDGMGRCFVSDGLFCNSDSGKCEARATLGQPCSADDFSCENSWCRSGVCAPNLPEGAACTNSVGSCAEGFVCEAGSQICLSLVASRQGLKCTCNRLRADGADCSNDRQCASAPCNGGRCQTAPLAPADLDSLCGG